MYSCICIYELMRVYTFGSVFIYVRVYMGIREHASLLCIRVSMYVWAWINMYGFICVICMYSGVYVCVCTCAYV